jgi:hypothetical protein
LEKNTYKINHLTEIEDRVLHLPKDSNGRAINLYKLQDCVFVNNATHYPKVLVHSRECNKVFNLIDEKVMSLQNVVETSTSIATPNYSKEVCFDVFFFTYNTDNYYHFVYDTLPYLISYLALREQKDIKLLMNYPNPQKDSHYKFVLEFLELLGIQQSDILILQKDIKYNNVYISDSYTHGLDSNLPPRQEIHQLYELIKQEALKKSVRDFPKKIYISRQAWKHNDLSNIGTNYTSRRLLLNEQEVVDYLATIGYEEVFTELLSTREKIQLFSNVTDVVGAIGGGLVNTLFGDTKCTLTPICSPGFLDVNKRFLHCFSQVYVNLFEHTSLASNETLQKYMRVQYGDIVGEITDIDGDVVTISYIDQPVAGWNSSMEFKTIAVESSSCKKLDNGLNCPWVVDLEKLKKVLYGPK